MKLLGVITGLAGCATAVELHGPLFGGIDTGFASRIPSSYESAVLGRRVLALTKLGTLSSTFPHSSSSAETRPEGLEGLPFGQTEYIADCEDNGHPTLLAIKISTSYRNADAGSNLTLSVQWTPPYPPARRIPLMSRLLSYFPYISDKYDNVADDDESSSAPDTVPYSAANLPRFALIGYLEPIQPDLKESLRLAYCYTSKHPDAKYWLPGNKIHTSEWARLVVTKVYWIGGFGDRAYIGWIPIDEWDSVTRDEWEQVQLPGEKKGWSEWSEAAVDEL
ncbi:pyridoxamine 5'-phosphate oxidase domain-containing protein [Trichoderma austrokoningii]